MCALKSALVCLSLTVIGAATLPVSAHAEAENIVLVHGMNIDGSEWRPVYDRLTAEGFEVTVVQLPLTSIADDVAATKRAIQLLEGPIVLVGHSYGGMVISQAGSEPGVEALVYVAAFLPEVGESLSYLNTSIPAEFSPEALQVFEDGHYLVKADAWIKDVANGLTESDARFTAMSQPASNSNIFGYKAEIAAWQQKPAWSAIATQDRVLAPDLQRKMSSRAGATTVEIDGGHLLPMSNPEEVAAIIKLAASSVD